MSTVGDILRKDGETYDRKAADYAPNSEDPFENFTFSGVFAHRLVRGAPGNMDATAFARIFSCCVITGIKISRLMTLGLFGKASNEGILDTLGDLRVYLGILEAMLREQAGPLPENAVAFPDVAK